MIKLVVFDFDGVLADCKELHFESLNRALKEFDCQEISREDHILKYDGLSTRKKLELLQVPEDLIEDIYARKQEMTEQFLPDYIQTDTELQSLFASIKDLNIKIVIASNAIRSTILTGIELLGLSEYIDDYFSNEDVINQKPHPVIYLSVMACQSISPNETIIVEDSKHGRLAAAQSGAYVFTVDSPENLKKCSKHLMSYVNNINADLPKWPASNLNVLIPMAGAGSRFKQAGYVLPKPLINVNGKPMIQKVVENLNIEARFIFLVQREHYKEYYLDIILPLITGGCNCEIIQVDTLTEGAACTALLAKKIIDCEDHLLIANSDQLVSWNSFDFMYAMLSYDGGILTFKDTHDKWSFAKVDENGFVTEVAEKTPISDNATCGIYYFDKGSDFVKYAEQMVSKNIRHNGEFYICPVYNQAIEDGKKIKAFECSKMYGLGTPEDLQEYLRNNSK